MPRRASAQAAAQPPFVLLVVQANGVVQQGKAIDGSTDPERFWPSKPGSLTAAALEADKASRATGELASLADRLSIVKGLGHSFAATGCMHASGDAQVLTAAKLTGDSNRVLALGESIDSLLARKLNEPGREPLVLHAGKYSAGGTGFDIPGYISYVGPSQPRPYVDSPYQAYLRVIEAVGTGEAQPNGPTEEQRLAALRSRSVNDVLRAELRGLLSRTDLSKSDRERLDQHLSSIRDLELAMSGTATTAKLAAETISAMQGIDSAPRDMKNHEKAIDLHLQLMAFAVASGYTRVAVLKIGDREDDHQFTLGGSTFVYHTASHRAVVNGMSLCSQVDFLHMRYFKSFVERLLAVDTPTGKLLDAGVAVWTNQVANGSHSFVNVPWILAGAAGGYLKTGQYVELPNGGYKTNRMLNTLLNAGGLRQDDGSFVDGFGDASQARGLVNEIIA